MKRAVAVAAVLGAAVVALRLPPPAAPGGAAPPVPPGPSVGPSGPGGAGPGWDAVGRLAAALEAALAAGDAAGALALFAPDAQVEEVEVEPGDVSGVAVLAAGPARVGAWVRGCLLPDVRLVPGTRRLGGGGATWGLERRSRGGDALGCSRWARPDALPPAWDMAPGEGTLTVAVAGGAIATLTIAYDPAWEQRKLAAQAAPVRAAQARATQTATAAGAAAAGAGGGAWWEEPRDGWYRETPGTRPAAPPAAPAPSTQARRTPSGGPRIAAAAVSLLGVVALTLGKTLRQRGHDDP